MPELRPLSFSNWLREWPLAVYLLGDVHKWSEGRYDAESIKTAVSAGNMQAWFALVDGEAKGCATTQIVNYPTGLRVVSFTLCGGGDFDTWVELADAGGFDAFAKAAGCQKLEAITRPGIGRALVKQGWREFQRFYERDVR